MPKGKSSSQPEEREGGFLISNGMGRTLRPCGSTAAKLSIVTSLTSALYLLSGRQSQSVQAHEGTSLVAEQRAARHFDPPPRLEESDIASVCCEDGGRTGGEIEVERRKGATRFFPGSLCCFALRWIDARGHGELRSLETLQGMRPNPLARAGGKVARTEPMKTRRPRQHLHVVVRAGRGEERILIRCFHGAPRCLRAKIRFEWANGGRKLRAEAQPHV